MKNFRGSETVEPGLYFNARQLAFRSMDEAGPLPGAAADVYRRVPTFLLLVVGPLLGLAYVVFLPFIGVAMVTWLLAVKAARLAAAAARETVRVLRPGWEPSMAFLSRHRPARRAHEGTDEWAEEVRQRLRGPEDGRK